MGLVPVFRGSFAKALALQASLRARDLETVIRDEIIKTIDPFVTGGAVLDVELLAPDEIAGEVEAVIQEVEREVRRESALQLGPPEASAGVATAGELAALGRRIRWAALSLVLAPVGLVLGWRYLRAAHAVRPRPDDHGMTLAAIALAGVELVVVALLLTL